MIVRQHPDCVTGAPFAQCSKPRLELFWPLSDNTVHVVLNKPSLDDSHVPAGTGFGAVYPDDVPGSTTSDRRAP
jgi:hypothetical protein